MSWIDRSLLQQIWAAVGGAPGLLDRVTFSGPRVIESRYPIADLAAATVGAAGLALAEVAATGDDVPHVLVDRGLAGAWFGQTLRPQGWEPPPFWDPIAGDYRCVDGWIRLHTNAPPHRAAALRVLGVADSADRPADRAKVAAAVASLTGETLESAVVAAGGCAAELRSPEAWRNHHQGMAVAHDPLVGRVYTDISEQPTIPGPAERPLQGLRVLDLTRVLAGPAATRFLAGFGAQVLRIDPPGREEPGLDMEMSLGKSCARMDLRTGRDELLALLERADVLIHGYRPGAMDGLGLGERTLHAARPGLVEVMLDAYGWSGPWRSRRGFDSLVQMSSGIAYPPDGDPDRAPTPLPVQGLDHATGYLMAAAALRGLSERRRTGLGSVSRLSLSRTAILLQDHAAAHGDEPIEPVDDSKAEPENTFWGPALRLNGPVTVGVAKMSWSIPAAPFGSAPPAWPDR
jgi:hypothetical protein